MTGRDPTVIELASRRPSVPPVAVVTLHLSVPVEWEGALIADIPLRDPEAGKAALAREDGGPAFGAVAAAVAMSGHPPEMLQLLADADSARLLFVTMALVDYGDQ